MACVLLGMLTSCDSARPVREKEATNRATNGKPLVTKTTESAPDQRVDETAPPGKPSAADPVSPDSGTPTIANSATDMPSPPSSAALMPLPFEETDITRWGLRLVTSPRVQWVTDVDPATLGETMQAAEALLDRLVHDFGPLPTPGDERPFLATGYLMRDQSLFRAAGFLPANLPQFAHGRHRGYEFWLNAQEFDYYQRHLCLHELTHIVTLMHRVDFPPVYGEGIAEWYATHRRTPEGRFEFGIMPASSEEVPGWGRFVPIANDLSHGKGRPLRHLVAMTGEGNFNTVDGYAWAWWWCEFFSNHPRYRDTFRKLLVLNDKDHFQQGWFEMVRSHEAELTIEWARATSDTGYGYDVAQGAMVFDPVTESDAVLINASRGWQATGWNLAAHEKCHVRAEGRVQLARTSQPWISTPAGISFDYSNHRPLGQLVGCWINTQTGQFDLETFPVGEEAELSPPLDAELFLRVNDDWSKMKDNEGSYRVLRSFPRQ